MAEECGPNLPLTSVVSSTLENQWQIQLSMQDVAEQKGVAQQTRGVFDWILNASENLVWRHHVQELGVKTKEDGGISNFAASLNKLTRIGTGLELGTIIDNESSPLFPFDRFSRFAVFFNIDQPLLRRFINNPEWAAERISLLELQATKWEMVQQISLQVRNSVQAYWAFVAARKQYEIQRDSLIRLNELLESTEQLIEAGQLAASEMFQQEAQISADELRKTATIQATYDAYNQLLFAMGQDQLGFPAMAPNVCLENFPPLIPHQNGRTINRAADLALSHRGDLIAAQFRSNSSEVGLLTARNGVLPILDVTVGGRWTNTEVGPRAKAILSAADSGNPERNVSAQVRLQVPICNNEAVGVLRQARAVQQRAYLAQNELQALIRTNVANAMSNLFSLVEQIEEAKETVDWYQKALIAEFERLQEGYSTVFVVIDFERRYSNAQSVYVDRYREYAQTLVELLFLTGTLAQPNTSLEQVFVADVHSIENLLQECPNA